MFQRKHKMLLTAVYHKKHHSFPLFPDLSGKKIWIYRTFPGFFAGKDLQRYEQYCIKWSKNVVKKLKNKYFCFWHFFLF